MRAFIGQSILDDTFLASLGCPSRSAGLVVVGRSRLEPRHPTRALGYRPQAGTQSSRVAQRSRVHAQLDWRLAETDT